MVDNSYDMSKEIKRRITVVNRCYFKLVAQLKFRNISRGLSNQNQIAISTDMDRYGSLDPNNKR